MTDLKDMTILITGGTGSFGNELLHNIAWDDCAEIRIFSRDELKQEFMRSEIRHPKVKFLIGDVRDRDSTDRVMGGVDLVFHAAALKQVPSCEFFPMEAVQTNILGSHNVIESGIRHGVKRIVCLSTDKAVYPVNAMGMTKALMEKIARAAARRASDRDTIISCVRYGNVMYSRGSVIPLFVKQIKEGKPLTITERQMTRFLLPLKQAIELVLFAFAHAEPGDIFVKKSPASTVIDLADVLKHIFGSKLPVTRIGIRHGEKMFETLATREELIRAEDMGNYYRLRMDGRDLNYEPYATEGDLKEASLDDYTSDNTRRLNAEEVHELLLSIPEIAREAGAAKSHDKNAPFLSNH